MYAVIKTGGKQYRVQEGDVVRVAKINADIGSEVTFDDVLMIGQGTDIKAGKDVAAQVTAVITEEGRGQKIVVFKRRRRKNYRLTKGHRQSFTAVRIAKIG
ncbi:MAG: 50S ribosomal protein L21 [Mariprofundaceae bacterium]|nr:50S ribosomal protein L21 [Mariprofundaceae bacterium]